MIFSTPTKVASGVVLTSTAAVGTALTYQYLNSVSLFQVEKEAIAEGNWTISQITSSNTTVRTQKVLSVSFSKNSGTNKTWTCTLVATTTNTSADSSGIKADLQKYFGTLSDSNSSTTATTPKAESVRKGFVTSCARNRQSLPVPTDSSVTSELHLLLNSTSHKFEPEDLNKVFSGEWENKSVELKKIEKLALEVVDWTIKQENGTSPFTISLKATATTELAGKYGVENNGSLTCSIATTDSSGSTELQGKLKTHLGITSTTIGNTETAFKFSDKSKREAFVNNCARNRKSNPAATDNTVTAELKINQSSSDADLNKVFGGIFISKN